MMASLLNFVMLEDMSWLAVCTTFSATKLIGFYQCSFRPGKSTIDQIFTLRQILQKTRDKQIDTYHLFIDFKSAFDTPHIDHLYSTMSEFGIPAKLIKLCEMTLKKQKV